MRIHSQPAFLLHTYPYRETSLLVELFSREHGRVALVAKGARRPQSAMRGLLLAFQPLDVSWFGKSEVKTLTAAEWRGGYPLLGGESLMAGFYMNELLLKLLAREDPHPDLYDAYTAALRQLAAGDRHSNALRRFEVAMLRELGYALNLEYDVGTGSPLLVDCQYHYQLGDGPRLLDDQLAVDAKPEIVISGEALLALRGDRDFNGPTAVEARTFMRRVLDFHLEQHRLASRRILQDLQALVEPASARKPKVAR